MEFRKKDLVSMADLSKEEITYLISLAIRLKKGEVNSSLAGKTLGMIFTKSSTRTRVSFEVGMYQLGGHALFLSSSDIQLGRGEPIGDTAKVLSRYVDGIMIRTFAHSDVETLAREASIPVINGLTDDEHPCQILADLQTVFEHKGSYNVKIAYVGDGNNVASSLAIACNTMGIELCIASPKGYELDEKFKNIAKGVTYTNSPDEALRDADVVYTDVWASMGQESEQKEREEAFAGFQINDSLTALCKSDYIFLHCLPAHRGEEVSSSVIDGPNSVVFDEAENRLHAQKAVLLSLMGK